MDSWFEKSHKEFHKGKAAGDLAQPFPDFTALPEEARRNQQIMLICFLESFPKQINQLVAIYI